MHVVSAAVIHALMYYVLVWYTETILVWYAETTHLSQAPRPPRARAPDDSLRATHSLRDDEDVGTYCCMIHTVAIFTCIKKSWTPRIR